MQDAVSNRIKYLHIRGKKGKPLAQNGKKKLKKKQTLSKPKNAVHNRRKNVPLFREETRKQLR